MRIKTGKGKTKFGTGIEIILTGEEIAIAIESYLVSHNIIIEGARTITVNNALCEYGRIYIDLSGFIIAKGKEYSGRTGINLRSKE
jgi:hypothetical protein